MFARFGRGQQLAGACWNVLMQKRELLIFPLLSTAAMVVVTVLFFVPIAAAGFLTNLVTANSNGMTDTTKILAGVTAFLYYLVSYTVMIYSNTALVGAVMLHMRGEPATVGDGLRIANARLGKILGYALIAATVGLIARGISRSGRGSNNIIVTIVAMLVGAAIAAAWNVITFLVVPILVVENVGPITAIKHSFELFKRTWGERLVGGMSIGFISLLLFIAAIIPGGALALAGFALALPALVAAGIGLGVLGIVFVSLLTNALHGIFQAALYSYATTGNAGMFLDTGLVRNAFQPKR